MILANDHAENPQDSVPTGFALEAFGKDAFIIHHKRAGMGCMNTFLLVWLIFWTPWCVFLLRQYLSGGKMEGGDPMSLWFVMIFWFFDVFVACLLVYFLFCKKMFRLDRTVLTIETGILGYKSHKAIPKDCIRRYVQIKDGGEGEDSFPSWGLRVEYDKKTTLILRQPWETSHWLGHILAKWAGVEFTEAPKE